MLFNKKIEPSCSYCRFGSRLSDEEIACLKQGVVGAAGSCQRFSYDPLKRVPPRHSQLQTDKLREEDFAL